MSDPLGSFVWYELMTSDPQAAEAFYRRVIGWGAQDAGVPGLSYTLFTVGEISVGGLMELSAAASESGARPGWLGYVAVDDVDSSAAAVTASGGAVRRGPEAIPGIGRFAVISDPQGVTIALFRPTAGSQGSALGPGTAGRVGWHELHATDREAAFVFYSGLFGWTKGEALDMGPMGIYQLFGAGTEMFGGMMTQPDSVPRPFWLYYFNVEAIEPAITRVREAGGDVLNGPHQVPGGGWIVQCLDPQGGLFALFEPQE